MARENLEGAVRVVERLSTRDPAAYARLVRATGLQAGGLGAPALPHRRAGAADRGRHDAG
jgi:hypothetical protein